MVERLNWFAISAGRPQIRRLAHICAHRGRIVLLERAHIALDASQNGAQQRRFCLCASQMLCATFGAICLLACAHCSGNMRRAPLATGNNGAPMAGRLGAACARQCGRQLVPRTARTQVGPISGRTRSGRTRRGPGAGQARPFRRAGEVRRAGRGQVSSANPRQIAVSGPANEHD